MRMHKKFSRFKTSGGTPLLGSDSAPTTTPPTYDQDNILICPFANNAGFPVHRIAVAYHGPNSAIALSATLYLWDDLSGRWYKSGAAVTMQPEQISYFNIVSLADPSQVGPGVKVSSGSTAAMLIVADGATVVGEHVFAMGPDLTAS